MLTTRKLTLTPVHPSTHPRSSNPQYSGHNIALEIQATLPRPPTVQRMMRGVHIAFVLTGIAYLCVACTGFHALGSAAGEPTSCGLLALRACGACVRPLALCAVS